MTQGSSHRMKISRVSALRLVSYVAPVVALVALAWQHWQAEPLAHASSQIAVVEQPLIQQLTESPEFQAVTDRTTELGAEEMPAYWQLVRDAEDTSFEELKCQPHVQASYSQLLQSPETFRGQLLQKELNVRRVLAYDVEQGTRPTQRLYEVWGWADDAPGNLYVMVTTELPDGMKIGASVFERAKFCGYFFKLQGYIPAGAEAKLAPRAAPLLIGRMIRGTLPTRSFASEKDWWRIGIGSLLVVSLIGSFVSRAFYFKSAKPAHSDSPATPNDQLFEEWLEQS